jgi:hypothetical protein
MAQDGSLPACENRGFPATEDRHLAPPDGIDASIKAMKATNLDAVLNRLRAVAKGYELPMGDHAMLPPNKRPNGRSSQRVDT